MGQQALNRKPNLSVRRRLQLDANTEIAEIGITVRKQMELTNNKSLTDVERGMHLMAAKILVNGQPIVYDDLMDGFTTEELEKPIFVASVQRIRRQMHRAGKPMALITSTSAVMVRRRWVRCWIWITFVTLNILYLDRSKP